MLQQEDVYRECLSGHKAETWRFGVDRSRRDGTNAYCKECIRNRVYNAREERRARGLTSHGLIPANVRRTQDERETRDLVHEQEEYLSEIAIQKNREKRQAEREIELKLRREEPEVKESSFSIFGNYFGRQGNHLSGWSCPKGTASG